MTLPVLPVVGSSGFYEFKSPFDKEVDKRIEYTCKAVRRISDYLANNEDVEKDVYEQSGIESSYQEDLENDAYIVSLQSKTGHWLYIPHRYILTYPSVNGVPYRTMMIGVALPPIPADQDLSAVKKDLKDLAEHHLGLQVAVEQVETSQIVMIPHEDHLHTEQERFARKVAHVTNAARIKRLEDDNAELRRHVQNLEEYIKNLP